MCKDLLKTFKNFKYFYNSVNIRLFEKSDTLKKLQKSRIKNSKVKWIKEINNLNSGPIIFICNEFFDSLPIKQFIKKKKNWFERFIHSKNKRFLVIDIKTKKKIIEKMIKLKIDNNEKFIEYSPLAFKKLNIISKILKKNNGGILIIDYGYIAKKMFNTLQSVKNHKKNNFLENIYQSDITHMINFKYYKKKN